ADPDRARARQPADLRRVPRPEDEVLEPFRPGDERVLEVVGRVDDAIVRPNLVHLAVLPREPGAAEDEEVLLRRAVRVGRSREHARLDADAVDADALRPGGVAEPLPGRVHLALGRTERL